MHSLRQLVAFLKCTRTGPVFSIPATTFVRHLREDLSSAGEEEPELYGSQSLRRGTAQGLLAQPGARLADVLKAGEWSSAAFMEYQEREEVDQMALMDLICAESDDEGETPSARALPRAKRPKQVVQSQDIRAFLQRLG